MISFGDTAFTAERKISLRSALDSDKNFVSVAISRIEFVYLEIFERLERKAKIVRLKNQNKHKRNDFGGTRIETLACTKRTYGIIFSVAL